MPLDYYLSKSDFVIAKDCPVKLYYKKLKYPTSKDGNEYMQHLAKGGFMVGKLATILYPDGILIDTGGVQQKAIELTEEFLQRENVTLFEAAIYSDHKLVRVDILEKKGNEINLIEVKSKSYESNEDKELEKKMNKDIQDKIIDVAYQYYVLTEKCPDFNIHPYLFLPDKNKRTKIDGLNHFFRMRELEMNSYKSFTVEFDESKTEEVLSDDIMYLVDVKDHVLSLQEEIKNDTKIFIESLGPELKKIPFEVSKDCFKCEFTEKNDTYSVSGYDECWKDFPSNEHHIKDLYHIGTIGGNKNPVVNSMIRNKRISLFDMDESLLSKKRGERQLIQLKYTKENTEWFSPELRKKLDSWKYPLHFIDFENTLSALPFHKGMRPYETVAFQWSCHTIEKPGDEPVHSEFLNVEPEFPNFRFAETLMDKVGSDGTFLMWSSHENTVLRIVYEQMQQYGYSNNGLKNWLEEVVRFCKKDSGKFIDLNQLTIECYFHPLMKGRTSIKITLPAVLSSCRSERIKSWLENFDTEVSLYHPDEKGVIQNPYDFLPKIDIYERSERVQDGTGAMRAYEDLIFGAKKGNEEMKNKYDRALRLYCKLDTLAMMVIWEHWGEFDKISSIKKFKV